MMPERDRVRENKRPILLHHPKTVLLSCFTWPKWDFIEKFVIALFGEKDTDPVWGVKREWATNSDKNKYSPDQRTKQRELLMNVQKISANFSLFFPAFFRWFFFSFQAIAQTFILERKIKKKSDEEKEEPLANEIQRQKQPNIRMFRRK